MKLLRKFLALIIGIPIVIIGVILIPLPGPGLLIVFAGLFVLSLEFEWALRHREKIQRQLKDILNKSRERADSISKK